MNKNLEENGFLIIKNFLPLDFCKFTSLYFKIRQDTLEYDIDNQCPESKSFYADPLTETLLLSSCKKLSEVTEIELIPQYSYTRVYGYREVLKIHSDRPECQFSATLCLGRPKDYPIWPIYFSKENNINTGKELLLEEGDLCFYRGTEMYHWRNMLDAPWYLQSFLHFVDRNGPYGSKLFDNRRALGVKEREF